MGSLDDAIREHLELKRRLGASDDEIKEKEAEAFGKGNRPAPPEPEAAERRADAAEEPFIDDEPRRRRAGRERPAQRPLTGSRPTSPSTQRTSTADEIFEPDEVPAGRVADGARRARRARPARTSRAEPPEEDVLEETPEFLEETPEQDRLWFEQRPPRTSTSIEHRRS